MKNQKLFDKTLGILVNAYLNDTLEYTNCSACAVGNLVAAYKGVALKRTPYGIEISGGSSSSWSNIISFGKGELESDSEYFTKKAMEEIILTGYTPLQIAKIEQGFYLGTRIKEGDKTNFNGLMSVCETLMKIHEANSEEITEAKRLFVKEPA